MELQRHFISVILTINLYDTCFSIGMFENVALNKPCSMSSQYAPQPNCSGAVNGNTTGEYIRNGTNCIHTRGDDVTPWWEVYLGRPYPVHSITIFGRAPDFLYRMRGVEITVDGKECYRFDHVPPEKIVINCTSGVLNGTVVRLYKNATATVQDKRTINVCEVQVLTCSDGYWGSDCSRLCGNCNNGEVCDKVSGHCRSCSPGWKPPLCKKEETAQVIQSNKVALIVGASLGALAFLIIIVAVVVVAVRWRRSRSGGPISQREEPRMTDAPATQSHCETRVALRPPPQRPQSPESEHNYSVPSVTSVAVYDHLQSSGDLHFYSTLDTIHNAS